MGAAIAQISFLYYSFYSNLDLLLSSGYDQQSILNLINEARYNPSWENIIENHSGKIEVESELGKGTTFKISLPIKKAN